VRRAFAGGCALALASGWNTANTGAVAGDLAHSYRVGLAVVGLLTTALFLTHLAVQIPGGRACDRFGGRAAGLASLAVITVFNAAALAAPSILLASAARALMGFGTGLAFIAGSAYVRASGGSALAQGLYGGAGLAGGGLSIAVVPQLESALGWHAPFVSALVVAALGIPVLLAGPSDAPANGRPGRLGTFAGMARDAALRRLAVLYGASLGLSIMTGNWVVTLLRRHGGMSVREAGLVGACTLLLGIVTRPVGGWILHARPAWTRWTVAASLVAGGAGTLALTASRPLALAVFGAALVGVGAGIPFAASFTGAALVRPEAPAASVGFVNGAASVVVIAGTPLLGLGFAIPGSGSVGFAFVAALWALALLALPHERELGVPASAAVSVETATP
jgi:nitrate/nitrite transporter NarK